MSHVRTFVAVELAGGVKKRAESLIKKLQELAADIAWVPTRNMHLTLKFLGNVPDVELNDVCRVVKNAVATVEPFEIVFRGLGAFPNLRQPRTLWLGVEHGSQEIIELQQAVEQSLQSLRFPKENRRFLPHLTLGRVHVSSGPILEDLADMIEDQADYDGDLTVVDEVVVMSSFLERNRPPQYQPIGHCELGTGASDHHG
ncbi:MAG: RNA 2',3'-cyclic phosphodiesterase [Planctomycetes bacterium]|nr:RNA 2',3'-cyclic phosphodiesterase [Planctomycetota bacterium]